uniref:Uncharacterized protein n=1 Tax=Setaria italica TaxID=4555 RepID=K3ZPJ6_SETIT
MTMSENTKKKEKTLLVSSSSMLTGRLFCQKIQASIKVQNHLTFKIYKHVKITETISCTSTGH